MRHRVLKQVDMLPLLDIILVVLFVFATIEEGDQKVRSDATQEMLEGVLLPTEQQSVKDTLQIEMLQAELEELKDEKERNEDALQIEMLQAELEKLKDEKEKNEGSLLEKKDQLDSAKETIRVQKKQFLRLQKYQGMSKGQRLENTQRLKIIVENLLKQNTIFEVEITENSECCFRKDHTHGAWTRCGLLPVKPHVDWLKYGGGKSLSESLQMTKGGKAIALIRQDDDAPHNIGKRLDSLIRKEFTDIIVYTDRAGSIPITKCSESKP